VPTFELPPADERPENRRWRQHFNLGLLRGIMKKLDAKMGDKIGPFLVTPPPPPRWNNAICPGARGHEDCMSEEFLGELGEGAVDQRFWEIRARHQDTCWVRWEHLADLVLIKVKNRNT